jgi:hypothetical protein
MMSFQSRFFLIKFPSTGAIESNMSELSVYNHATRMNALSAFGQKGDIAALLTMSALPPKADIQRAVCDVR